MLKDAIKALTATLCEPRSNKFDQMEALTKSLEEFASEVRKPLEEKIAAQQKLLDAMDEHLSQLG